jgi:biopolymer transport protein ExbB
MHFDIIKIIRDMDIFATAVVVTLLLMAMASMAVFFERLWVFFRSRRHSRRFAHAASDIIERRAHEELITAAEKYHASHLAGLLAAGVRAFLGSVKNPGQLPPIELTRRELERKAESVSTDLRRGMSVLASVGSVAPFVGLLGTVIGIIAAFQGIAAEGSGGLGAVSAGIAEALVVTAFGLVVAIPSVLAFNFLNTRADNLLQALEQAKGELIDHLENTQPQFPMSRPFERDRNREPVSATA